MHQVLGNVTISQSVFAILASKAALKVEGVSRFGTTLMETINSFITRNTHQQGITVQQIDDSAVIFDIRLVVDYGFNLLKVAADVQKAVIEEVEAMTGYRVDAVNVTFVDIRINTSEAPSK